MEISSTTPSWGNTPSTTGTTGLCQTQPEPQAMTLAWEAKTAGAGWPGHTRKLFAQPCKHWQCSFIRAGPGDGGGTVDRDIDPGHLGGGTGPK